MKSNFDKDLKVNHIIVSKFTDDAKFVDLLEKLNTGIGFKTF